MVLRDEARQGELTEAMLKCVIEKSLDSKAVDKKQSEILEVYDPIVFIGTKGFTRTSPIEYEQMMHFLKEHTNTSPKKMSLIEIVSLIDKIKNNGK